MAIALLQGHVQRAIEFYNKSNKYFVIGGTTQWADEGNPTNPVVTDYKLQDIVAFKRVDNCYLVVPDENGSIQYRTQNWRTVLPPFYTTTTTTILSGSNIITLDSLIGIVVGNKLRISDIYEGVITNISGNNITLSTSAPTNIATGAPVEGGALVEGAKYIYIDCYLNYDQFPIVTYRQLGVSTGVTPNNDVLRAAAYSASSVDEFTYKGILEILDNRVPSTRNLDQREHISLIIEM